VQGAFYGSALPSVQIEALIAAHVPRIHIKDVAEIYGHRWWDYRRLAPGHSFYLFTHHYYQSIRIAARRMLSAHKHDRAGAKGVRRVETIYGPALVQQDVRDVWERDKAHISGLWKAMLVADAIGMPYGEFCRIACKVAIERLWKRLPRPSQLYSDKLGAYVLDEWERLQAERLFFANHMMYAEDNYAKLPVQDAYREWLVAHIQKQDSPITGLMEAVYVRQQLPEDLAAGIFPANAMKRARLLAA
jgi:hypothetical protein